MTEEVFYVIYTTTNHDEAPNAPSYLQLIHKDQHMLQSNLYDASKYVNKDAAETELQETAAIFTDYEFAIIPVDRRIFGPRPRWVVR